MLDCKHEQVWFKFLVEESNDVYLSEVFGN